VDEFRMDGNTLGKKKTIERTVPTKWGQKSIHEPAITDKDPSQSKHPSPKREENLDGSKCEVR